MGGHDKRGRWRIGRRATVLNIMGGSDIDLNDAELSGPVAPTIHVRLVSIMGGSDVVRGRKLTKQERRRERELRDTRRDDLEP